MKISIHLILLALTLVPSQAIHAMQKETDSINIILQWTPQAQFAGYFVAKEKGFYKEHGLDLTIIAGGPDKVVSDYLDSGTADFGTMFLATALERRDSGMPVVNVGQILHHSTLMLIAKAGTGIETIADLDQKKVALWANEFQLQPYLLFKQLGIDVEIVPLASSMDLFIRDAVSATSAMWYNEYHTILSFGLRKEELQPFFFRDTAFDFPEDGIYCLENTLQRYPEAATGLLKATLQGWQYAFAHEEEALDIVARAMTEAKLPMNRVHQRWMFRRMRDTILTNNTLAKGGILPEEAFTKVMLHLLEGGAIRNPVAYDTFYRGPLKQ